MSWGRRIIEGEEFRIKKGGSPINKSNNRSGKSQV